MVVEALDIMKIHRMLAHPSENITRKMAEPMESRPRARGGPVRRAYRRKRKTTPCQK